MSEKIEVFYAAAVSVLHVVFAVAVTWHAVLHKRESRTVAAWVGLAWLAPILGSLTYLCLGINRIERIGASLEIEESRKGLFKRETTPGDARRAIDLLKRHPTFSGLARAGKAITGRPIELHNDIQPLIDGDEAYPAMLEAINEAKHSVALLSYIFDNDRVGEKFFEALVAANQRGVEVRVLVDYVGSRYSPKPTIVKRLKQAGIEAAPFLETRGIGMFRYANLRNHRKILVVDGSVGFTGGTNIREGHWLSMEPAEPVQCLHFKIEGPVVSQMLETFAIDWDFTTGEKLTHGPWIGEPAAAGDTAARGVTDGPDEDLDKMLGIILSALSVASKRVSIITPYFLPEEALIGALVTAALRGVEIDIVLPEKNNIPIMDWATEPQLPFLIEKGCRIHRTPAPFDHTKLVVVDSAWALIGSTNWDARSLRLNFEYNLECYGEEFGGQLDAVIQRKIRDARLVTMDELHSRSRLVLVRNGIARLFSPYL
tara:strand:- start:2118 stop:3572 length:1455 start_codon:yes stop_codon:yes gene_type:complete